jgi:pimeloyl-ACP methyl ester carboxylesterase
MSESTNTFTLPTVVLVHGAFADASGWTDVFERLKRDDYPVIAPANPLRSLSGDSAYIKSVLEQIPGPLVVVAHSYGGAVITNAAAGNPNVKALVYVDGFIPEIGEQAGNLAGEDSRAFAASEVRTIPPFGEHDQDFYLKEDKFREVFCADLDEKTAALMHATQRPIAFASFGEPTTEAAWKTIPSWAVIGLQDRVITPESLRFMAERAGSTMVQIDSSHVSMISHSKEVADLIKNSAEANS